MSNTPGHDSSGSQPDPTRGDHGQRRVRLKVHTDARGHPPVDDPHAFLDVRIDSPGREGLTGTTPANLYKQLQDEETITLAPDWRPMEQQPTWRRDFPIDWPQDHYVARRDFAKFLVLTSFAFVVGQVWIGMQSWRRRAAGEPEPRRIARLSEVPVGGVLVFGYPREQDKCVLIRVDEDVLLAYSQKCTHLACDVVPRPDEGLIRCPCHAAYFDLMSGRPLAGPPRRPLPRIHLEVRGEYIYATGVELRTV